MELTTPRLLLRSPCINDAKLLAAFEAKNHSFWSSYASATATDLTQEAHWIEKLKAFELEAQEGRSVRFLIFDRSKPQDILGTCNFTQIFRGAFQACYLGYKLDQDYEGQGMMQEALRSAIAYVFEELNLHRIMAAFVPSNLRSQRLLEKLGFELEGLAKNYLLIDGRWQDHILTALTNPTWNPSKK